MKKLILILFFVTTLSLFKIAFWGINTSSNIKSSYNKPIYSSSEINFRTKPTIKILNDETVGGDIPLVVHIETPYEEDSRYKRYDALYKNEHKIDFQPVESEKKTP